MPEERIIPAVETVAEFKIKIEGEELPRTVEVVGVHISKEVNRISLAKFVVKDGDVAEKDFVLSNGDLFTPGNKVEISAGTPDEQVSVFSGIIVKQSVSIRGNRASHLIIECRHIAVKATVVRRSNCLHEVTDDAVITTTLTASGLSSSDLDIEATTVTHPEMVQYNCTDWDYAISCAEAAGLITLTNGDKIVMKTPDLSATASLSLLFGATIIELDAEMDSRTQYKTVKAVTWDMASQELTEATASEPSVSDFGNIQSSDLADVTAQEEYIIHHGGAISPEEIKAWANANLLKSRLAKIRGRVKFEGIATINAGDMLELHGLGERFSGNAFVSGVRHDYTATEGWKTQAQFGHTPEWFIHKPELVSPKAGGLLPGTNGLHTGIVTDNEDPEGEFRVRVKIPFIHPNDDGVWARIALADAGADRGLFYRPEVGDEVLLGFLFDDPRQPVIIGMLHSSALPSPLSPANDNHFKGYTSRGQMKMIYDDDKKEIKIETPGGNVVTISDDQKAITLVDLNSNKVEMTPDGINISDGNDSNLMNIKVSPGTLLIKAATKVTVEAPQIALVDGASHPLVYGDSLLQYLNQIVQIYSTHTHPGQLALGALPVTPAPPVPPLPPATASLLSVKVKTG